MVPSWLTTILRTAMPLAWDILPGLLIGDNNHDRPPQVKTQKSVKIKLQERKNQRTNGPVNAHLRSAAYTNKHV